ncbi:hypothetical protein VTI74DRAFT_9420 [Chaetomium olivicolor]
MLASMTRRAFLWICCKCGSKNIYRHCVCLCTSDLPKDGGHKFCTHSRCPLCKFAWPSPVTKPAVSSPSVLADRATAGVEAGTASGENGMRRVLTPASPIFTAPSPTVPAPLSTISLRAVPLPAADKETTSAASATGSGSRGPPPDEPNPPSLRCQTPCLVAELPPMQHSAPPGPAAGAEPPVIGVTDSGNPEGIITSVPPSNLRAASQGSTAPPATASFPVFWCPAAEKFPPQADRTEEFEWQERCASTSSTVTPVGPEPNEVFARYGLFPLPPPPPDSELQDLSAEYLEEVKKSDILIRWKTICDTIVTASAPSWSVTTIKRASDSLGSLSATAASKSSALATKSAPSPASKEVDAQKQQRKRQGAKHCPRGRRLPSKQAAVKILSDNPYSALGMLGRQVDDKEA